MQIRTIKNPGKKAFTQVNGKAGIQALKDMKEALVDTSVLTKSIAIVALTTISTL